MSCDAHFRRSNLFRRRRTSERVRWFLKGKAESRECPLLVSQSTLGPELRHIRPQESVDPSLVAPAKRSEPLEHISIHTKCHLLLARLGTQPPAHHGFREHFGRDFGNV